MSDDLRNKMDMAEGVVKKPDTIKDPRSNYTEMEAEAFGLGKYRGKGLSEKSKKQIEDDKKAEFKGKFEQSEFFAEAIAKEFAKAQQKSQSPDMNAFMEKVNKKIDAIKQSNEDLRKENLSLKEKIKQKFNGSGQ